MSMLRGRSSDVWLALDHTGFPKQITLKKGCRPGTLAPSCWPKTGAGNGGKSRSSQPAGRMCVRIRAVESGNLSAENLPSSSSKGKARSESSIEQKKTGSMSFCTRMIANEDERCGGATAKGKLKQMEFVHKVSLDVPAALELVWRLWSDLRCAPRWMRWIDRVEILCEDGTVDTSSSLPGLNSLSRWTCSTSGFEVSWVARIKRYDVSRPQRVLQWVTVEGLPNAGEVIFTESSVDSTKVELSISHGLPSALARIMTSSALMNLVKATLQSDLERFQKLCINVKSGADDYLGLLPNAGWVSTESVRHL